MGTEAPKSSETKKAEAALEKASSGLKATRDAEASLDTDLGKARTVVGGFAVLHTLTAAQHLAFENAKRTVLRLEGEQKVAAKAVEAAEAAVETAQEVTDRCTLADLDASLRKRDAALVAEMTAAASRWDAERALLFADLAKAHTIASSLRPDRSLVYTGGSRGSLIAMLSPRLPIAEVVERILENEITRKHAAVVEAQHAAAAARGTPEYMPPKDPADWTAPAFTKPTTEERS
jgi:hypothetical protein